MAITYDDIDLVVGQPLRRRGVMINPEGEGRFRCDLPEGTVTVTVRQADGWISLQAQGVALFAEPLALLSLSATLPGGCRLALAGDTLVVLADFPRDPWKGEIADGDLHACLRGFALALGQPAPAGPEYHPGVVCSVEDVAAMCRAAGWRTFPRAAGNVGVPLATSHGYAAAQIACRDGGARVALPLALLPDDAPPLVRDAVAGFLLRANAHLRYARAVCDVDGQLRSEVTFARRPLPSELNHALTALSVTAMVVQQETRLLLEHAELAALYTARFPAFPGLAA